MIGVERALAGAALCLLAGCGSPPPAASPQPAEPPSAPWFEDEAAARGLAFTYVSGASARYFMPEIMGGGVALFDMDGDDDLDAYFPQGGPLLAPPEARLPNRLFRNLGGGVFEDATAGSGAGHRGYGTGVAAGDYDGDGDTDLYVTNVGANVLLRNDGAGRFSDQTAAAGVGDEGWGASAVFVDYDGDADLDLYALNYLIWSPETAIDCHGRLDELDYCGPEAYNRPAPDVLYRNDGDGTFTDVTVEAGMGGTLGTGLGVVAGDFTGDGLPDLFVANDGLEDFLWVNQGDGTFENQARLAGCATDEGGVPKAGMGVTACDLDDDLDLDIMVGNLHQEGDSVFLNEGGYFVDVTARVGLTFASRPFTRFGMGWVDFDNDGRLDLYQANGRVARQETPLAADPFAEPNLLFRGLPGPSFVEVEPRGGTPAELVATSRGAAFGDVDGDGGVDLVVVNRDAPASLLMNRVSGRGNWIGIRLEERTGAPALGARVTVRVGDRVMTREARAAYSYLTSSDPTVHLGLGAAEAAEEIRVRWTDGSEEAFDDVPANRYAVLRRGQGL